MRISNSLVLVTAPIIGILDIYTNEKNIAAASGDQV